MTSGTARRRRSDLAYGAVPGIRKHGRNTPGFIRCDRAQCTCVGGVALMLTGSMEGAAASLRMSGSLGSSGTRTKPPFSSAPARTEQLHDNRTGEWEYRCSAFSAALVLVSIGSTHEAAPFPLTCVHQTAAVLGTAACQYVAGFLGCFSHGCGCGVDSLVALEGN